MKKLLLTAVLFCSIAALWAQAPNALNYQAVVRGANGQPVANNTAVQLRFTIHDSIPAGAVVFTETVSANANAHGLVATAIGGTANLGNVVWSRNNKFLQVEANVAGAGFTDMGTTQLLSVPYAVHAADATHVTMFPSGTNNTDRGIVTHSPAYPQWGMFYDDTTDAFSFRSNLGTIMNIDLNNGIEMFGELRYAGSTPGVGKVLASDANGVASWKQASVYTELTVPGCQDLATANATFAKIADIGTFTKNEAGTKIEVDFQSHFYVSAMSSNAVIYELRIDGAATTVGMARAFYPAVQEGNNVGGSIHGVFTGLGAGSHTVSIWARTAGGTASATTVMYDGGCYSSTSAVVKESW